MKKSINSVLEENKDIFESLYKYYLKKEGNGYSLYLKSEEDDLFTLFEDPEEERIIIKELLKTNIEIR